jgi:hypothetical protein
MSIALITRIRKAKEASKNERGEIITDLLIIKTKNSITYLD